MKIQVIYQSDIFVFNNILNFEVYKNHLSVQISTSASFQLFESNLTRLS